MNEQMLEILMGKYLDSEITASEQQILEAELQKNSQAKEFLEQMNKLHEKSREAVCSEIIEKGESAEEIFERAWQQQTKRPFGLRIISKVPLRFVAGLAAGLVIGFLLHFFLVAQISINETTRPPVVENNNDAHKESSSRFRIYGDNDDVIRNVDWYHFTDKSGQQWVVEGFRENMVRPAVYKGDL